MALVLNEEQQMLRDSARSFFQERSSVSDLRKLRDEGEEWSPDLWAAMIEMGWTGIVIPEEYGGLEFGYVGAGVIFEECGRMLASSPLLSSALVCSSLIAALGSDRQKQAFLPPIASGELIMTLAVNETSRFDPSATGMTAVADGNHYSLTGAKVHVIDGGIARKLLVVARIGGAPGDQNGLGVFIVDRETEGVSIASKRIVDICLTADVQFDTVSVSRDALLGETRQTWRQLEKALDIGATCSAAEMLGIAQEAFERTVGYLKERKQFGVLVGSFQSLQHRAARLFCELKLCKSVVLSALQAIDEDRADRPLLVSMAKAKSGKTAQRAVNEAVQMHGGIGMTDDFDIGFFMKRAAIARQDYGDHYYHVDRFAQLRGY